MWGYNSLTYMNAPLSKYWAVEYHFNGDAFHVSPLPDYLRHSQQAFINHKFFDSVILALHPTEQGARDECEAWMDRREKSPCTVEERLAELRRYVAGLETQL